MSSAVVERPSEQRTAPIAQSSGTPIATSTCDGSMLPAVHADPADTPMPLRSSPRTMDSDSSFLVRHVESESDALEVQPEDDGFRLDVPDEEARRAGQP